MGEVNEVQSWIEGFQQSIDFIEENLASSLEIEVTIEAGIRGSGIAIA